MVNNTNKKKNKKEPVANSCLDKRPVGPSGDQSKEVVANGDHPEEVIANCENPQETNFSQYDIEKLIVTVRGEQVLIDQGIARIYGVTTVTKMEVSPETVLQLLK